MAPMFADLDVGISTSARTQASSDDRFCGADGQPLPVANPWLQVRGASVRPSWFFAKASALGRFGPRANVAFGGVLAMSAIGPFASIRGSAAIGRFGG